ncbi:MAG: DEAD/DEAH box helicase [Candidatus Hodarchaeales archaeon]|jgi:helicase
MKDLTKEYRIPDIINSKYKNLSLFPPQLEAVYAGLLSNKNFVIAVPTATGKTLLAELSIIEYFKLNKDKKIIYLSPLRALSSEKFTDFRYLREYDISVQISTGDFDKVNINWKNINLLITTNEKLDSLIRSNSEKFKQEIGLVIIDECHLIDDADRGPTLEVVITKLRMLNKKIKFLALSATIKNANEIAEWLNATLIESSWRSVPIVQGIATKTGNLYWTDRDLPIKLNVENNILATLVEQTLLEGGQVLVFTNNRKSTKKLAENLVSTTEKFLTQKDQYELRELLLDLSKAEFQDSTTQTLQKFLINGVAFHHAGLANIPRTIIEKAFRLRLVKVIVATPTLSTGVNLPARRVIINSFWRYSNITGTSEPIKAMEYEQMRGRSGRPQYDDKGETIVITKSDEDVQFIKERYFSPKGIEPITSKLASEPALRMHILGVVATGIISSFVELFKFIKTTFYNFQYRDEYNLEQKIIKIVDFLAESGFIRIIKEKIEITSIGKRTALLYIDPLSARRLLDGIVNAVNQRNEDSYFPFLHLFCTVPDIRRLRLRNKDWEKVEQILEDNLDNFFVSIPSRVGILFERFLTEIFTAEILRLWIEEEDMAKILNFGNIEVGDLHRIVELGNWISYSTKELLKELKKSIKYKMAYNIYFSKINEHSNEEIAEKLQDINKRLENIEIRLKYGIKSDLVELVQIKHVGRVRARILAQAGITIKDLPMISAEKLEKMPMFGSYISRLILSQFNDKYALELKENRQFTYDKTFDFIKKTKTVKTTKTKLKDKQKTIREFF